MASNIRKPVQRLTGWLFIVVVMGALAAALHVATQPTVEVGGPIKIQRMH